MIYVLGFPLRIIFFKQRPKKRDYSSSIGKFIASSFPSLHTTRITVLSMFFVGFFNDIQITFLILIIWGAVLYSRIFRQKHYYTDVIAGFFLGILIWIISFKVFWI